MRRIHVTSTILNGKEPGHIIELHGERAHYLRDVLRLQPGDLVELFDGQGMIARTEVVDLGDSVRLEIDILKTTQRGESPIDIELYQGIPKGKRWEWLLEKVTELGVTTIVPVETKRTVVTVANDRLDHKMSRWKKKLAAASRQCGRTVIPTLSRPVSLDEAIEKSPCDVHLVAHPMAEALTIEAALAEHDEVASVGLWIGPEGGFAEFEIDALIEAGAIAVGLGPRILRTDTAAIAAMTLVQTMAGDLDTF